MKYKILAWALVLTVSSAASLSSFATTNELLNLEEMTNTASTIVTAEVVSTEVDSSNNRAKTMVTMKVTDAIKGDTQTLITVLVPGGSYSRGRFRVGQTSPGTPRFFAKQDALLFLNESQQSNTFTLVGHDQGYMSIRDSEGEQVLQNLTTGGKEMSVSNMKQQILEMEVN